MIHGEERRKIVYESLKAIEDRIAPVLERKKSVVIKPNDVSTRNPLATTNADALRGILVVRAKQRVAHLALRASEARWRLKWS